MKVLLNVNGHTHDLELDPEMPLLWALRDVLGLTGTKYGCGIGLCGSCTVHVDGVAERSCLVDVQSVDGRAITTIEGLAGENLHPVQEAWLEENVSQCGYCQPGQIMSAVALLNQIPQPTPAEVNAAMSGNLCRCGTYQRIRKAIARAAAGDLQASSQSQGSEALLAGNAPSVTLDRYLPTLLPIAGAIAFAKDGQNGRLGRRGFLQVAAAAGLGLVIGVSLPGCSDRPDPTSTPPGSRSAAPTPTSGQPPASGVSPEAVGSTPTAAAGLPTSTPFTPTDQPTITPSPSPLPSPTPEPTAFFEPNLYLTIDNNGIATVVVHRVEMGQGARTALPMLVAEELEVEWSSVRIVQAPGDSRYGEQQTAGSDCIVQTYAPMRLAGAQARDMLIEAAALTWGVDFDSCIARNGTVIHESSGQVLPYGELVETAATLQPRRGRLKGEEDFRLIGSSISHYDGRKVVDGSLKFGIDTTKEEMLYAVVARNPELRAPAASFDSSESERVTGVRHIVPISSGIAVVAENTWAALEGRSKLNITFESGRFGDLNSQELAQQYRNAVRPGTTEENVLDALYQVSFLAHATPSPMNCTADVRSDGGDVWAPTQTPQYAQSTAITVSGVPAEGLVLHVPRLGGGFGRRLQVDYVRDAVEISRRIGTPVKVMWTREDDIKHDYYHPLSVHYASADLTRRRLPNIRSRTFGEWDQITGAWRAVSNFTDGFVRECFLDEMAEYWEVDPVELRLEVLPGMFSEPLEIAAERAGWGSSLPDGRARGIAAYATWNSTPVVMITEVSMEDGLPRVHRVVTALNCGIAVNPDMVAAQMEGGIVWGLSALLGSEITIVNGQVQQSNFHDYPILRMDQMPEVEVHIVPSTLPPRGVGEMGVPPIAPAVLNAMYQLSGSRVRNLPLGSA